MNIQHSIHRKSILLFLFCAFFLVQPPAGFCQEKLAGTVKKNVDEAVSIRAESQKKEDQWEMENAGLNSRYEALTARLEQLEKENEGLTGLKTALQDNLAALETEKRAAMKIQKELIPFLEKICLQLEERVTSDPPFLKTERHARIERLKKILADPDISLASKYLRAMDALHGEAEYANTIEVFQEKIQIHGEPALGHVFRLGRVSLFFLSLDETFSAVFDVAKGAWQPLDEEHLPAVRIAVKIGSKERPVELLPLPVGKLAPQGGIHE